MTFWEGSKLGAIAGLIYSALKNPGSCACCAVLLLIIALLVVVFAVALVMAMWKLLVLGAFVVAVALVVREVWRGHRG